MSTTLNLVPTDASRIEFGDRIMIDSKVWTIKYIDEPDSIGTYTIYLFDEYGNSRVAIVNGLVTLVL